MCKWAQSQVKFCGQVIGSGKRFADTEKVNVIKEMNAPKTKTEFRQILGFFSYFREYNDNFAVIAKPLTDLTAKQVPAIPWKPVHQHAFDELKRLQCKATTKPLYVIDFSKPLNLFVDASGFSTSSILTRTVPDGTELPIAFPSTKLNATECARSTIEHEAYAALMALQKYRNWIFGSEPGYSTFRS